MHRRYSRMRETVFDLYTERDALPGYYRALALFATWLALGGYVLFALAFTSGEDNLKPPRIAILAAASTLLLVGYIGSVVLAFISRSLLFTFDNVLIPILTSSFVGVFVTVVNHALHKEFQIPTQAYIYVPLATACTTTIATAIVSFLTYRKIHNIKNLDKQRRQHLQRWERNSYGNYGDAASTSELLPMNKLNGINVPEDEAQRRQLLRLLLSREGVESPGLYQPPSTYQITLPGDSPGPGGSDGLQVVPLGHRPRAGSLPSNTAKFNILGKIGRDRSPTVESFKNPRERRRDEIERSSILLTPGSETAWGQASGTSLRSQSSTYFNGVSHHS